MDLWKDFLTGKQTLSGEITKMYEKLIDVKYWTRRNKVKSAYHLYFNMKTIFRQKKMR